MTNIRMDKNRSVKGNSEHLALITGRTGSPLTEVGKTTGAHSLRGGPGDAVRCVRFEILYRCLLGRGTYKSRKCFKQEL